VDVKQIAGPFGVMKQPTKPVDTSNIGGPFGVKKMPEVTNPGVPGVAVNTEQRFNAIISFVLNEKESGKHWFSAELKYSDLPYALAVALEREGVSLADRLTAYGEAAVNVKKA
jgi:hypothetical protein